MKCAHPMMVMLSAALAAAAAEQAAEQAPASLVWSGSERAAWRGAQALLAAAGGARAGAGRAARGEAAADWLRWRGGGVVLGAGVPLARAGPLAARLRDLRVLDVGDAAPPAAPACLVSRPPPRAPPPPPPPRDLLALADPREAAALALPPQDAARLQEHLVNDPDSVIACGPLSCVNGSVSPAWCAAGPCGDALAAGDAAPALLLAVRRHRLRLRVWPLSDAALLAPAAAPARLRCLEPAHAQPPGASPLRPPPCPERTPPEGCPFETLRYPKLIDSTTASRWPRLERVLTRFSLTWEELRALGAAASGPRGAADAARDWLRANGTRWAVAGAFTPRLLVLVGEGAAAESLAAAAAAAERELNGTLKVQARAGGSRAAALRALTGALGGGDYGALSAVAAGGGAWRALAPAAGVFRLGALALRPAAAAAGAVLAAGAAGERARALALWAAGRGWRRVAVLADADAAPALGEALAEAGLSVLARLDLPDEYDEKLLHRLLDQWLSQAADAEARVVLVAAGAAAAAAALCAGARAGLLPARGAAWLLTEAPAAAACAAPAALLHVAVAAPWDPPPAGPAAPGPPAGPALLRDAAHLWARALLPLLADHEDLHHPELIRSVMENIERDEWEGATGRFEWQWSGGALVRRGALQLRQWSGREYRLLAETAAAAPGGLRELRAPRWLGPAPRDAPACAAWPPAGLLRRACLPPLLGAAVALLAAALLAALAALAARRRAAAAAAAADLAPWELPRDRLVITRRLGVGAFGIVYHGHALLDATDDAAWTPVAVKTLRYGASTEEKIDFLAEAETMKRLSHANVVRLLGVVTRSEPACCVLELLPLGDLRGYLLARRALAGAAHDDMAPRTLTRMGRDAARALGYLHATGVVHRDVAARNCLVGARRQVKLGDFGMARALAGGEYYRLGRRGLLPVRWLAPESVARGEFSPASDVWALGVLLGEVASCGARPLAALGNRAVAALLARGGAPGAPGGAAPRLQALLAACWAPAPDARPAASEVAALLAEGPPLLVPHPPHLLVYKEEVSAWGDADSSRGASGSAEAASSGGSDRAPAASDELRLLLPAT